MAKVNERRITASEDEILMLPRTDIIVTDRFFQTIDEGVVEDLVNSIKTGRLINPIIISQDRKLISGMHRLKAYEKLRRREIPCFVVAGFDERRAKLLEIDENLVRRQLTALEQAEALVERDSLLYHVNRIATKARNQDIKANKGGAIFAPLPDNTNKVFAREVGMSVRSLQLKKQIARNLAPEAKDIIRNTPVADNQINLERISKLSKEDQIKVSKLLTDGNNNDNPVTVQEALEEIRTTKTKPHSPVPPVDVSVKSNIVENTADIVKQQDIPETNKRETVRVSLVLSKKEHEKLSANSLTDGLSIKEFIIKKCITEI